MAELLIKNGIEIRGSDDDGAIALVGATLNSKEKRHRYYTETVH